jgi:hypothetical protein
LISRQKTVYFAWASNKSKMETLVGPCPQCPDSFNSLNRLVFVQDKGATSKFATSNIPVAAVSDVEDAADQTREDEHAAGDAQPGPSGRQVFEKP